MERKSLTRIALLLAALVLPSLGAWLYYAVLSETSWAGVMYLFVKIGMVAIGIIGLSIARRTILTLFTFSGRQVLIGLVNGALIAAVILIAYFSLHTQLIPFAAALKIKTASLFPLEWYVIVAVLFSLVHAFFEEWYWRAFVNGELQHYIQPIFAMIIGSVAFTAHHAIVLSQIFPSNLVLLMCTGIFIAGIMWSYLAKKTGSYTSGWISHVIADGVIFALGALLMF